MIYGDGRYQKFLTKPSEMDIDQWMESIMLSGAIAVMLTLGYAILAI